MGSAHVDDLTHALWDLAQGARWFAGRSRGGSAEGVSLGEWLMPPSNGAGLRSAVLDVVFASGERERYHVPLVYRPVAEAVAPELTRTEIDGVLHSVGELCDDPAAAGLLLELLASDAPGFERWGDVPVGLPARRFTGEQSNTSLFFGDKLVCKVFRRLEDGPNVDVELHRALAGTGAVAEIHGAWRQGQTDLAIFTEALPQPLDGYDLACKHAREATSFADHARSLGSTLARVHRTLADELGSTTADAGALTRVFDQRFDAAAAEVPEVEPYRNAVRRTWDALPTTFATQRIHGDCHLGQVLLSAGEWRYVDFEGEPLKTLEERRQSDSRWRDVAGMLRSFDYAAAAGEASPDWLSECRAAFLEGYGSPEGDVQGLLDAFEADKAVYEVIYERRNRPQLMQVPIDSLNRLAGETR
ncbi:MAG: phosphotransferase [Propionibacteriaceae bacterium]|nr:phosphotransferase [Propionibacteriaceae bacterium]